MSYEIRHEPDRNRFVTEVEGRTGVLRYRPAGEATLDFTSTWVDRELRGRGVGEALVRAGLDHARHEGCKVIPSCWFVRTVVERNPAHRDLLQDG